MGIDYDPWKEAATMSIDIIEAALPRGYRGLYEHERRRITLSPGMSLREARSTLAHELAHARRGDTPTLFGPLHARQELRANRDAAALLIDADEYAQAERLYGCNEARLAYVLDVTVRMLRIWKAMMLECRAA